MQVAQPSALRAGGTLAHDAILARVRNLPVGVKLLGLVPVARISVYLLRASHDVDTLGKGYVLVAKVAGCLPRCEPAVKSGERYCEIT